MLEKIKQIIAAGPQAFTDGKIGDFDKQKIAAAALMIRQARVDTNFDDAERAKISALIQNRFDVSAEAADHLIEISIERDSQVLHPWIYTAALNETLGQAGKVEMIQMMWEVAYADGTLDPFEEELIVSVSGYLSVSDADRDAARAKASGG